MKKYLALIAVLALFLLPLATCAPFGEEEEAIPRGTYNTPIYVEQGGAKLVAETGSEIEMQSGSTLDVQSGTTTTFGGDVTVTGTMTAGSLVSTTQSLAITGNLTQVLVNLAGASANPYDYTGSLGIMNGSDDFTVFDVNITNADHTSTGNVVKVLDVANITGDADATETAINIGTGWDSALTTASPITSNYAGNGLTSATTSDIEWLGFASFGNGTPDGTTDGLAEAVYIEGALEVDGIIYADGAIDADSTSNFAGTATFSKGSGDAVDISAGGALNNDGTLDQNGTSDFGAAVTCSYAGNCLTSGTTADIEWLGFAAFGNGTPDGVTDGTAEAVYVEGGLEVDGIIYADGAIDADSTANFQGAVTLQSTLAVAGAMNYVMDAAIITTHTVYAAADSGTVVVFNNNATDLVTATLPSAAAGLNFVFFNLDGDDCEIDPASGDTIQILTNAAGDAIANSTAGNLIGLVAIDADRWVYYTVSGTWTDTD